MDEGDLERIRMAVGAEPLRWRTAPGHGATSNRRYWLHLPGGRTAFAKIAAFDYTADWLRGEHLAYESLAGESVVPRMLGWHDDGAHPVLIIEDLSDARWPPPWSDELIDGVLTALDVVHPMCGSTECPRHGDVVAKRSPS